MVKALAEIIKLIGEAHRLCSELSKYKYYHAECQAVSTTLTPNSILHCDMYMCRLEVGDVDYIVFEDGSVRILNRPLSYFGIWRREDLEKLVEIVELNKRQLEEIKGSLVQRIEELKEKLVENILFNS
jgi:hypothetical protein